MPAGKCQDRLGPVREQFMIGLKYAARMIKMKWAAAILLPLIVIMTSAAQARTRDAVMAGAFRCAPVGDARPWLDCYYGAAQPMRAQLGLASASAAQIALAAAPPSGRAVATPQARARDEVMSQAFHCTDIDDDRRWLDCYYAAAQPMRAFLNLPAAPQAARAPMPPPMPSRSAAPVNDDHLVARVTTYTINNAGIFTLTLANGETWRQITGDTAFAKLTQPPGNYVATINKGFFGSYNMTIHAVPGLFRVQRVR